MEDVRMVRDGYKYDVMGEVNEWGEWEPMLVVGLGWLIYSVEDTAGSITLYCTEERVAKPPMFADEDIKTKFSCKLVYYGTYGNDLGKGCLYTNVVDNIYVDKVEFDSYENGDKLLDEYLTKVGG